MTSTVGSHGWVTVPAELASQFDPSANVVLQINPIVFDGPLPPSRTIAFVLPPNLPASANTVTLRTTLLSGATYTATCSLLGSSSGSTSGVTATETVASTGSAPQGELAFTGGRILMLLCFAASMLSAGAGLSRHSRRLDQPGF